MFRGTIGLTSDQRLSIKISISIDLLFTDPHEGSVFATASSPNMLARRVTVGSLRPTAAEKGRQCGLIGKKVGQVVARSRISYCRVELNEEIKVTRGA